MSSIKENISIREASEVDFPALSSLGGGVDEAYFRTCLETGRVILTASCGGAVAGYAMLNRAPHYALYRKMNIPEIQDIHVASAFRRRGIATALIRACEALVEGPYVGIAVGLHAGFGAAQRLYVKMGYVPDGYGLTYDRQPVRTGEMRPVDDNLCLMMVKDLSAIG